MSRGGGGATEHRRRPGDEGSASLASVSVVVVTAVLAVGALAGAQALAERSRVAGAADASALAAADAVAGLSPGGGGPCDLAASAARVNDVELVSCVVEGAVVTVRAAGAARLPGVVVQASATAGPPPAGTGGTAPGP